MPDINFHPYDIYLLIWFINHYNISEVFLIENCVDPVEMPLYAASHLGFHNLMVSYIEYGKCSKISNIFLLTLK